jgi:hypothetical protein
MKTYWLESREGRTPLVHNDSTVILINTRAAQSSPVPGDRGYSPVTASDVANRSANNSPAKAPPRRGEH